MPVSRETIDWVLGCLSRLSIFISATRQNTAYVEVAHGGHLGFYEGGFLYPNPVTWLDRTLVAMVGSLVMMQDVGKVAS